MAAQGSLATLGVAELLQVAALFRKMGSLRLRFEQQRTITVYFQDGFLSGLTDSGRVWQLGELLGSMGRLSELDKQRLLTESKTRGKRLGQLLVEEGHVSRAEMGHVLRRLIMQSLLFAVENERSGEFEMHVGAVSQTSVMFPITDFLIEITSSVDELERLRALLGPGSGPLAIESGAGDVIEGLSYRRVQVLAHVDGEKTPMDVAATSPLSPTETLRILCELAQEGVIVWVGRRVQRPLARVFALPLADRSAPSAASSPAMSADDTRTPKTVW